MFYKCTQSNFVRFLYAPHFPGMQPLITLRETVFFNIWNFATVVHHFVKPQ